MKAIEDSYRKEIKDLKHSQETLERENIDLKLRMKGFDPSNQKEQKEMVIDLKKNV